jgi:hypothetical protein
MFNGSATLPFVIPTGAEGSAVPSIPITMLNGSATLPFVIPTGAERSGGICGAPLGLPEFSVRYPQFRRGA